MALRSIYIEITEILFPWVQILYQTWTHIKLPNQIFIWMSNRPFLVDTSKTKFCLLKSTLPPAAFCISVDVLSTLLAAKIPYQHWSAHSPRCQGYLILRDHSWVILPKFPDMNGQELMCQGYAPSPVIIYIQWIFNSEVQRPNILAWTLDNSKGPSNFWSSY